MTVEAVFTPSPSPDPYKFTEDDGTEENLHIRPQQPVLTPPVAGPSGLQSSPVAGPSGLQSSPVPSEQIGLLSSLRVYDVDWKDVTDDDDEDIRPRRRTCAETLAMNKDTLVSFSRRFTYLRFFNLSCSRFLDGEILSTM